jgi:hypothetical protein
LVFERKFERSFKILKAEPTAASLEGPFDKRPQIGKAQHGDRTLPSVPNEAVVFGTLAQPVVLPFSTTFRCPYAATRS